MKESLTIKKKKKKKKEEKQREQYDRRQKVKQEEKPQSKGVMPGSEGESQRGTEEEAPWLSKYKELPREIKE